jgi:hypothetical protein
MVMGMAMTLTRHKPQYNKQTWRYTRFDRALRLPEQNWPKMVRGKFVEMLFTRLLRSTILPKEALWNTQLSPDLLLNFCWDRR